MKSRTTTKRISKRIPRTQQKTKLLSKKIIATGFFLVLFFVAIIILYLAGKKESLSPDQNFIVTVNPIKKTIADDRFEPENKDAQLAREISMKVYEILSDNISSVASLANPSIKHIRVQPGMRKEEIADILAKKLNWDAKAENIFLTTRSVVALDDIKFTEGYYFPTGYSFEKNTPPEKVAEVMISEFKEEIADKFASSTKSIISIETALKIASIIERESNGTRDMRLISGIIWNRIFNGMSLDIDATLQYAKGSEKNGWWPKVLSEDKYIESPYNTYQNKGLPPSPISSPSMAAIQAALNPKKTECLFYLHDKRRNIHCSVTYQEHVKNINRYY
ncbi:MAG: UPF0755 protein [Parcubacteria group bacterium LiPW_30]|nr:MAG: UPF0755 protein [Parcubacteria group bacterium LiPW_30]